MAADRERKLEAFFRESEERLERSKIETGKCLESTGIGTSLGMLLCQLPNGHGGPHLADRSGTVQK